MTVFSNGLRLPKTVPSYIMFMDGKCFKAGLKRLIATARTAMGRRKLEMSPQEEALLKFLFDLTQAERTSAVRKSRKELMIQRGLR